MEKKFENLNLKNFIKILCLVGLFLVLIFPLSGNASKGMVLDLNPTDISAEKLKNRKIGIWRVDPSLKEKSLEEVRNIYEKKTEKELGEALRILDTGENGQTRFEIGDLGNGRYYLRDLSKVGEMRLASLVFEIPDGESSSEIDGKWEKDIKIRLHKTDRVGKSLKGAGFKLYRKDGSEVIVRDGRYQGIGKGEILYTDENGVIEIKDLPEGDYYFKEVEVPEGYVAKEEKTEFEFKGSYLLINVINDKVRGGYGFIKTDPDSKFLKGARFLLMKEEDGKLVRVKQDGKDIVLVSNGEGRFEVKDLPYGKYYLKELEAPKGYQKLKDEISFIVDGESEEKLMKIVNKPEKDNPPSPPPHTGDVAYPVLWIGGIVLAGLGLYLLREDKKKG